MIFYTECSLLSTAFGFATRCGCERTGASEDAGAGPGGPRPSCAFLLPRPALRRLLLACDLVDFSRFKMNAQFGFLNNFCSLASGRGEWRDP